ncbi:MAG: hypothetical protein FWH06_05940 [Oscillospiraceae bacterium]|nr:hypothetical protein [Oscillospiraceae bacterium]
MKKSRFLTFMLSSIPGCGLMYLGYMKKGLQNMLMFTAAGYMVFLLSPLRFEWIQTMFVLCMPVLWLYQMFDAMHSVSRMKRQEIEIPEDDGFFIPQNIFALLPARRRAAAKAAAAVLILAGSFGILNGVMDNLHYMLDHEAVLFITGSIRSYLVPAVVSLALIVLGVRLLKGSKNAGEGK